MTKITAPFTLEQVQFFNNNQNSSWGHPYTCCSPESVPECQRALKQNDGVLIATPDALVCPCGQYKQTWFTGQLKRSIPKNLAEALAELEVMLPKEYKEWAAAFPDANGLCANADKLLNELTEKWKLDDITQNVAEYIWDRRKCVLCENDIAWKILAEYHKTLLGKHPMLVIMDFESVKKP